MCAPLLRGPIAPSLEDLVVLWLPPVIALMEKFTPPKVLVTGFCKARYICSRRQLSSGRMRDMPAAKPFAFPIAPFLSHENVWILAEVLCRKRSPPAVSSGREDARCPSVKEAQRAHRRFAKAK